MEVRYWWSPFADVQSMIKVEFSLAYNLHQSVADIQHLDYQEVKALNDELAKLLRTS